MTLKEKFLEIKDSQSRDGGNLMFENEAKECEKIADEFAIEFAEWAIDYSFNGMYSNDLKELLEEFKKEKGL